MTNLLSPKAMIIREEDSSGNRNAVILQKNVRPTRRVSFRVVRFSVEALALTLASGALLYLSWHNAAAEPDLNAPLATAAALPSTIPAEPAATIPSAPASPATAAGRIRIGTIGVDMPIVEGQDERALYRGAWRSPFGSTPDVPGNTILFGHRYLRLPPHPETFYSLDKIAAGDTFEIIWRGATYQYRVVETRVVPPDDISVLQPTSRPIVTLITCTPVFTTKNRLIVRGELIAS